MIKIKNIVLVAIVSILIYACSVDNPLVDDFDHEAQATIDNDTLVKYLTNHYYDAVIDSIKPIETGKTALIDDSNLKTEDLVYDNINYKMYYYIVNEGNPDPVKNYPTKMDSILTKYQGSQILTNKSASVFETQSSAIWLTLDAVIPGWSYGFTHFKGGKNNTTNGPITYINSGKGFLFIPSGLAYRNIETARIFPNSCLIFRIELLDIVENTDHDNDGLASHLEIEDVSEESDPTQVDTDDDGTPNYRDADDDNDGIPTIKEDANGDGDPRNDFSDPNNPTLPDYLNPNIR